MSERKPDRDFFQHGPELANTWQADDFLQACLRRMAPQEVFDAIAPGLERLGERAAGEMLEYAADAERNPPVHIPFDPWGRRIDDIRVADGWHQLHRVAAEEGIVATAYERKEKEYSRLHQFARLYLYHPSSAICSCPLAMTDGAARLIEKFGDPKMQSGAFARLTSRDPEEFWTSGQWMTERAGGSDVSGTATIAKRNDAKRNDAKRNGAEKNGSEKNSNGFTLHGTKWFTSATTSQMAFTLARIEENGEPSNDLSLFYLELRNHAGQLDNIEVHRLKDKLGTKALPTAELTLHGTPARLVGEPGNGVRNIATLLNITRLYNACSAASQMRRAVMLASDYANRRKAFGKKLAEHPLHADTLDSLEAETRVATLMVMHAAMLLGREETGAASDADKKLLRLQTPLIKLYTAKQAIAVCSEALECFGGAGYVEDSRLPWLLRDAQVLSIWEGTTNVLSLDMLRAAGKDNSIQAWMEDIHSRLLALQNTELAAVANVIDEWVGSFEDLLHHEPERHARIIAYRAARILGATLFAEHAAASGDPRDRTLLQGWLRQPLIGQ